MRRGIRATILAGISAVAITLTACSSDDDGNDSGDTGSSGDATEDQGDDAGASADVTLDYWLWDDNQMPAYQKCADAFTAANPNIAVEISQFAWDQYWQNLTTQLSAGSAPDVWTNHASYYPQFVVSNQMIDIQPFVAADGVDTSQYVAGLADIYVKDDARYGLPKDWDTIALVYNTEMLEDAGIDPAMMDELTWNPQDGGTFEEVIAQLTVDGSGRNGLDPDFDTADVDVYGFQPEWSDGAQGQNGWGNLAVSNGFGYLDEIFWGTEFEYDDPALVETIEWLKGLSDKGYAPPLDLQSTLSRENVMADTSAAMTTVGSWAINAYVGGEEEFAFAPLPVGPEGRKSAINGLSDAIWAGTEHPDEAWQWVKFLGSSECQNIVADEGVVFPAIAEASENALEARQAAGVDVSVFVDTAAEDGTTFFLPVIEHGNEVNQIVQDAIQRVALGQSDAETALTQANEEVSALFR